MFRPNTSTSHPAGDRHRFFELFIPLLPLVPFVLPYYCYNYYPRAVSIYSVSLQTYSMYSIGGAFADDRKPLLITLHGRNKGTFQDHASTSWSTAKQWALLIPVPMEESTVVQLGLHIPYLLKHWSSHRYSAAHTIASTKMRNKTIKKHSSLLLFLSRFAFLYELEPGAVTIRFLTRS